MSINIIDKAIKAHGSQVAVAAKLKITPQRLNNWIRLRKVPKAWEWGLARRLGVK